MRQACIKYGFTQPYSKIAMIMNMSVDGILIQNKRNHFKIANKSNRKT